MGGTDTSYVTECQGANFKFGCGGWAKNILFASSSLSFLSGKKISHCVLHMCFLTGQEASLNPGKGANLNYIFNPFYFLEHLKKRLRFTYMYISLYIYP